MKRPLLPALIINALLVVLARKLLRIAFAVWRSGKPFEPQRFATVLDR